MTQKITLSASKADYRKCFGETWIAPPKGFRVSGAGDVVHVVFRFDGDIQAVDATWGYVPPWRKSVSGALQYVAGNSVSKEWKTSSAFRNWR